MQDARVISNSLTDWCAAQVNLMADTQAQLSLTYARMRTIFATTTTAAPTPVVPSWSVAEWGTGSSSYPTISKTATGIYTATALPLAQTPGTWLNTTFQLETVVFNWARCSFDGPAPYTVMPPMVMHAGTNVLTVYVPTSDPGGVQAITSAATNGGLVKLGMSSTGSFTTGDNVMIQGAVTTGGLVVNGPWTVTVTDGSHLTLQSSTWTGSWSSGGTIVKLSDLGGGVPLLVEGGS